VVERYSFRKKAQLFSIASNRGKKQIRPAIRRFQRTRHSPAVKALCRLFRPPNRPFTGHTGDPPNPENPHSREQIKNRPEWPVFDIKAIF